MKKASIASIAVLIFLGLWQAAAEAQRLDLYEMAEFDGEQKTFISVDNLLGFDAKGRPHLNIDPDGNTQHRQLVSILSAGMPFDDVRTRDNVASILAEFPSACRAQMILSLEVSPVLELGAWAPKTNDQRRVTGLDISGCLAKDPPECFYDIDTSREVDFDLRRLNAILKACQKATRSEQRRGAPFAEAVYRANPQLKQ